MLCYSTNLIVDDIDTNPRNVDFILQVAWNKCAQICCDHRLNIRGQQVQSTKTFKTSTCDVARLDIPQPQMLILLLKVFPSSWHVKLSYTRESNHHDI